MAGKVLNSIKSISPKIVNGVPSVLLPRVFHCSIHYLCLPALVQATVTSQPECGSSPLTSPPPSPPPFLTASQPSITLTLVMFSKCRSQFAWLLYPHPNSLWCLPTHPESALLLFWSRPHSLLTVISVLSPPINSPANVPQSICTCFSDLTFSAKLSRTSRPW